MGFLQNMQNTVSKGLIAILFACLLLAPAFAFATDPPAATPATTATPAASVNTGSCLWDIGYYFSHFDSCNGHVGNDVAQVVSDPVGAAYKALASFIWSISSWLLIEASFLFNFIIIYGIFQFSTIIGGSTGLLAAWGILRDIGNILLLFGFIFMGIATILNLHSYPVKKTIPALIIFAVLLNFSLFAANTVIDSSNLLSATFYKQAAGQGCDGSGFQSCANVGIAALVLQMSGVNTENGAVPNAAVPDLQLSDNSAAATAYLGLALFNVIVAFVLVAGAIMLIIRAVTLTFLMVLSPIGFAGMAVPFLHGFAEDWWKRLINQSFFAPVFILLMFVSLKIMESVPNAVGSGNQTLIQAALTGHYDQMGILVIYVLTVGFMIASLMAAKSIGAYGADFATSRAAGMVTWPFSMFARNTVGRWANSTAHNIESRGRLPFARDRQKFFEGVAGSSMSLRAIPGLADVTGLKLGKTGGDAAKGYHGVAEGEKKYLVGRSKAVAAHEQDEADSLKYSIWELGNRITAAQNAGNTVLANRLQAQKDTKETELKEAQAKVSAKRDDFQKGLDNSLLAKLSPIISTGKIMKEAAADIRKDLAESPRDKLLKQLQQATGAPATPAPAPAGGGGAPPAGGSPPAAAGHCWVAREVYGEDNPKWLEFRAWLHTNAPVWLWNLYGTYGEGLAVWLKHKPILKNGIRVLMDAAVDNQRRKTLALIV